MRSHKRHLERALAVVHDKSGAFLSSVPKHLPNAQITIWVHIVQTFARGLGEVREAEALGRSLPKHLRAERSSSAARLTALR